MAEVTDQVGVTRGRLEAYLLRNALGLPNSVRRTPTQTKYTVEVKGQVGVTRGQIEANLLRNTL